VSGNDPKDITGLLAEVGRNLTKEFDKIGKVQPVFNVVVKNSMVKGSNLLSFCDLDGICGGNVVIEDSFVDGTNVASWNREDKEKARIEEQKKLEEARKWEKEEADRREKARLEQERQIGHRKEAAGIQRKYEYEGARIEQREKSSGGKWFFGVILIFGVMALGWYGMQGSNSPQASVNIVPAAAPAVNDMQKTTPSVYAIPVMTVKTIPSAAAVVTSSADQKTITNSIGMEFVMIPAGEFEMGSTANEKDRTSDEGPVHQVKIAKAFYMGKYEVTQKQWQDVMGNNPSYFKGDDLPVEQIWWNDIQDFITKLNEKEGANKYRLPTEAEWEYSARAGTTTMYSFGDDESKLGDYAWYNSNSGSTSHEVGQKKPNPWGLYDMHGNVWEWVQDGWHDDYNGAPTDGSLWESDSYKVARSGGFSGRTGMLRSAARSRANPPPSKMLGIRLLRIS
jgi:formylglycine-generating enzyme required for sulfatase activity